MCTFNIKRGESNHFLRGSVNKLVVPFPRTNYIKDSFSYRGSTLWNSLPCNIRESGSLNQFKRLLYHNQKTEKYFLDTSPPPPLSKGPPLSQGLVPALVFHYWFCNCLYRCHSFISSSCRLSPFYLSNVAFSRPCPLLNFTVTEPRYHYSGGPRKGARGARPFPPASVLDQTETRRAGK